MICCCSTVAAEVELEETTSEYLFEEDSLADFECLAPIFSFCLCFESLSESPPAFSSPRVVVVVVVDDDEMEVEEIVVAAEIDDENFCPRSPFPHFLE